MTITVARQAPGRPAGLKLVILAVLAVSVAGWLEPRLLRDPVGVVAPWIQRLKLARVTTSAPLVKGEIMSIQAGSDGALWVASKYALVRYPAGEPDAGRRVLDSGSFRERFGRPMQALSALDVAPGGVWVGTWYGSVLRYRAGAWIRIPDRQGGPTGRINAILEHDGIAYIGGERLWAWSGGSRAPREVEAFPRRNVTALARGPDGALLAGTRAGVLVRRDGVWRHLWPAGGGAAVEVSALHATRDGHLLVATQDGFEVLDAGGQALYRELEGSSVTGFAELGGDTLWVSTLRSGVHVRRNGTWRHLGHAQGLGGDAVEAMAADARERLWLAVNGRRVSVAEAAHLERFTVESRAQPPIASARAYPDACAAALAEIGANGASGGVAVDSVAGKTAVYFGTRQVCPPGTGYRRDAGTLVTIADDVVRYRRRGEERLLPLPARAAGATPSASFVDSRGGLWLGFRRRGLVLYRDGAWRAFGRASHFAGNDVRAIAEDDAGAIWVATHPRFEAASGRHRHAGLHRYDGRRWTHLRPTRRGRDLPRGSASKGLAGASANTVRLVSGGRVVVGTNGGLSIHEDGLFSSYQRAAFPGLGSNFIEDIVEDAEGRLWLAHGLWGRGVSWKSGFLFHNRSARDGLLDDRIDRLAFDARGNVWMRSSYGATTVYPLASLLD